MESLTDRCIKAIADENISELNKLIEICDSLHRGIPIEGYNIDSIPSDDLYMGMEDKIKEINGRMMATMMKQQVRTLKRTSLNTTTLGEMWMGSDAIIKSHSINSSMVGKKVIVTPKYDGCSCAIRFVIVNDKFEIDLARTRGRDVGTRQENTNLTKEMRLLLNDQEWFSNMTDVVKAFDSTIESFTVRGEIVVIDKSKLKGPAAPYIAGKINSTLKNLNEDHIVGFRMFEVMEIIRKGVKSVPIQSDAIEFMNSIDEDLPYVILDLDSNEGNANKQLNDILHEWKETLGEPIDGVVYCEPNWSYPTQKEELGVNYGKFALKPDIISASRLVSVSYTIQKDGKLVPIINFTSVEIDGRKISCAKSCISDLYSFIVEDEAHYDSIIEFKLARAISPQVTSVHNDEQSLSKEKLEMPTKCPWCGSTLLLDMKATKTKRTVTLSCTNDICDGVATRKLEHFFKLIGVKNVSTKTIEKNYIVKNGQSSSMLTKMTNLFEEVNKKSNVREAVLSVSVADYFMALDLFTKTTLSKNKEISAISTNLVSTELRKVKSILNDMNLSIYTSTLVKISL